MSDRTDKMYREVAEFFKDADGETLHGLLNDYDPYIDDEIRSDELKLLYYVMLRVQGVEHTWAAMSACRKCGRQKGSDKAFCQHANARMENMTPYMRNLLCERAKKAGINTHGKYHVGGLGGPDDPKAWVSNTSDIKRVCEERNYSCEGFVNVKGQHVPPKVRQLAPDLENEMIHLERKTNPDADRLCKKDPTHIERLRGLVREKYAPLRKG